MPAEFRPFLETANPHTEPVGQASFAAIVPPPTVPPGDAKPCANVSVELKRDGDRITQIRVHCRCGEVIELACDYP